MVTTGLGLGLGLKLGLRSKSILQVLWRAEGRGIRVILRYIGIFLPGFAPGRHSELQPLRAVSILDNLIAFRQKFLLEKGGLDASQGLPEKKRNLNSS